MTGEMQTFEIECPNCQRKSLMRYRVVQPGAEGDTEVKVNCMHCEKDMMVPLPRKLVPREHLVRGLPGEVS